MCLLSAEEKGEKGRRTTMLHNCWGAIAGDVNEASLGVQYQPTWPHAITLRGEFSRQRNTK